MQVRIREAEKRASAAVAAERAATKALDLVKDQKAQSIAAIAEVDGVRKQLELAHDNVRIKDAMLESQAELIKSLKDENARNKEATSGAVKAAVDAERAASSRAKSTENDLHALKKDLAGADAAIERLEKALEEVTARRDAAEDAAADARRGDCGEGPDARVRVRVESVKSMFAQREDGLSANATTRWRGSPSATTRMTSSRLRRGRRGKTPPPRGLTRLRRRRRRGGSPASTSESAPRRRRCGASRRRCARCCRRWRSTSGSRRLRSRS